MRWPRQSADLNQPTEQVFHRLGPDTKCLLMSVRRSLRAVINCKGLYIQLNMTTLYDDYKTVSTCLITFSLKLGDNSYNVYTCV